MIPERSEKWHMQRTGLLAQVHIAKKDLALSDDAYRDIMYELFKKDSAGLLTVGQLERLAIHFEGLGWKRKKKKTSGQARALRDRAEKIAADLPNGTKRLAGMCRKICGMDRVEWVRNVAKMKRLVAAMEKARRMELAEYRESL